MMIKYRISIEDQEVQQGELQPGEYVLGRSRSADIRLSEPDISGRHLKLTVGPDGVIAENLSSQGTVFKDGSLSESRALGDGDILFLGKRTRLQINQADMPEAASDDRDRTKIPGAEPVTTTPESKTPPPVEPPSAKEDRPLETDVMRTRLASLEEMNLLRHVDKKRSAGKLFKYILGIAAAILALILLYTIKSSPKEVNLSWPVDSKGSPLGAFTNPGNGGHQAGGFSLAYPNIKGVTTVEETPGRITINTRIGRDASVPMRIIFIQESDPKFLTEDRKAVFTAMLAGLQKDGQRWNLAQISDVFFIGSGNGLPCLTVEYRREVDGASWYGEIIFFRTGKQAFMRLAETPVNERARAQNMISNTPFFRLSPEYLQVHWEGNPDYKSDGDVSVMLTEISRHLSKQAPFEWPRTYLLLQNVLMESTRKDDEALTKEALTQLRRLRNMQMIWYNSQKIQYDAAKLNNDQHQEYAVLELCKTVFSSPDDLRYFSLRRNIWE